MEHLRGKWAPGGSSGFGVEFARLLAQRVGRQLKGRHHRI
jgi:hypothetical protein